MSNETHVTLQGWMGTDVTLRRAGGALVAHFRVACTPRRYHRRKQEWYDAGTQWYSVTAWRDLADNCGRSLRRGEPVVLHGRLDTHTFVTKDGEEVSRLEVEATHVGHDLSRGTTRFHRASKQPPEAPPIEGKEPPEAAPGDETGAGPAGETGTDPWSAPDETREDAGAIA